MTVPNVKVSNRGAFRFPEIAQALGPVTEGAGGSSVATLYGTRWVLALLTSGVFQLFQDTTPVTPLNPLPVPPSSARHIALAFDQNGRPVIAWEDGGNVYVSQWDSGSGTFVARGPFSGVDPCLVSDPTVMYVIPNSDVVLYYLSAGRTKLKHRAQREFYAVEREGGALSEPGYLDQMVAQSWKVQAVVGLQSGATEIISSDLYPITQETDIRASADGPLAGALTLVLMSESASSTVYGATDGPISGTLVSVLLSETSVDDVRALVDGPISGTLVSVLMLEAASDDLTASVSGPGPSSLVLVRLDENLTLDMVYGTLSGPSGGTYA